jgi:putative lipoic acid-binding regulatory protein
MNTSTQPTLIEYPCDFPIKIMGRVDGLPVKPITDQTGGTISPSAVDSSVTAASREHYRQVFTQAVLTIVKHHAPDFEEASLEARISKKNTYLSLTCTIRAISRGQLDALYQELGEQPMVVMVL